MFVSEKHHKEILDKENSQDLAPLTSIDIANVIDHLNGGFVKIVYPKFEMVVSAAKNRKNDFAEGLHI